MRFSQIPFIILAFICLTLISCNSRLRKAFEDLEKMPTPDYSYIVQPEFSSSKEIIELKIKELYNSEEVKIGAVGFHGYEKETNKQIDERYWMKAVLLNSKSIIDFKDESKMNSLGREIAGLILNDLQNKDKYDKIEITFVLLWNDGSQRQIKQNIFYKIPSLDLTTL